MRQVFITAAVVAAGLLAFSPVQASDSNSGPRFGVVDANYIGQNSHRGQQGRAMLQQLQNKLISEVNAKQNALSDLKQKIDAAVSKKSADLSKLQQQFADAQRDAAQSRDNANNEYQQAAQNFNQSLSDEFTKVVNEYAKDNHYDMIFLKNSGTAYADDSYDVTTGVLKAFDADWDQLQKVAPSVTKAAPSAATKH